MQEEQLYGVIDFILNQATSEELKVVTEALKRRLAGKPGAMGLDPAKMGKAVSDSINSQISESMEQVHRTVRDFVAGLIKQEVPDIPEEHLRELVDTWTPSPKGGGSDPAGNRVPRLPPDVLSTMINQFLSYSLGVMSILEQERLRAEIPDWHEEYWKRFPSRVRKLISQVLKGELDKREFWKRMNSELGLDQ